MGRPVDEQIPYRQKLAGTDEYEKTFLLRVKGVTKTGEPPRWVARTTGCTELKDAQKLAKKIVEIRDDEDREGAAVVMNAIASNQLPLKDLIARLASVKATHIVNNRRQKRTIVDRLLEVVENRGTKPLRDYLKDWVADRYWEDYHGNDGLIEPETKKKYIRQIEILIDIDPVTRNSLAWFAVSANLLDAFRALGVGTATMRKYLVACSQFAKYLMRQGYITKLPVGRAAGATVPKSKKEKLAMRTPKFPEESDIRKLLAWEGPEEPTQGHQMAGRGGKVGFEEWRFLIAAGFGGGVEVGGAAWLKKESFNLEKRRIEVPGTKNIERFRPVTIYASFCWDVIEQYVKNLKKGEWALARPKGMGGMTAEARAEAGKQAPLRNQLPIRYHILRRIHKAACKATGVKDLGFHNLRHGHAVWGLRNGIPKRALQDNLGHAPNSTMFDTVYGKFHMHDQSEAILAAHLQREAHQPPPPKDELAARRKKKTA